MEEKEGTNKIVVVIAIILLAIIIGIVVKVAILDSSKLNMKTSSELLVEQTELKYKQKEQVKEQIPTNTEEMELGNAVSNDQRLEKIATIYNDSTFIKDLNAKGTIAKANAVGNSLNLYINGKGTVLDVKLNLEGNVLSTEVIRHTAEENTTARDYIAIRLLDSIAVYKGEEEGTIYKKITSDLKNIDSYSLVKDGFEIKEIENGNGFIFKVDLNNDFSIKR